ncbi:MAG: NosD domain-containing protein [Halobacteria archaeon]
MVGPPILQRISPGRCLALCLPIFVLFFFVNPVAAQACYTPPPNSTITRTTDTTLCQGTYNVNITLGADNIRLNCNGSTLFGNGTTWRYIVGAINRTNVTVENCIFGGAMSYVYLLDTNRSMIQNNTGVESVAQFGVNPDITCNSGCIYLKGQYNNNTITRNVIPRGGGGPGIINLDSGTNNHDNFIEGNLVNNTSLWGIYLAEAGLRNRILNNTISNAANGGIRLEGQDPDDRRPNYTVIINNTATRSTNSYGLQIYASSHSIVAGNNFSYNRYGIRITENTAVPKPSFNNTIHSNILAHNNNFGISFQQSTNINNLVYLNVFRNNTQDHVSGSVGTNSFNTTLGNSWDDLNPANFTDSDSDGLYDSGPGYPYQNSTGANATAGVTDSRPCKYQNCLALASRTPAWNSSVSSQTVFFSLRSQVAIAPASISVGINGAASTAFSAAACASSWSDLLGNATNCTYTETGIVTGSNSVAVTATDANGTSGTFYLNFTYSVPATPTPVPVAPAPGSGGCCPPAPPPARAGEPVVVVLPPGAPVERIEVVTDEPVAVKVSVKPLLSLPLSAPPPPGPVARFMEVSLADPFGEPVKAKSVAMEFSVERTWMNQNGVEQERVALARLEGARPPTQPRSDTETRGSGAEMRWAPHPARVVGESPAEVKFKAEVPGTSIFAITAVPEASPAPPSPTPAPSPSPSVPAPSEAPRFSLPPSAVHSPTPRQPGFEAAVAVVAALFAAARRNRNR